jgi:hypothetical protein
MSFANDLELRAIGLMRSGNHAILEWIQQQFAGEPVCFLNNVGHGDHDPFASCVQMVLSGLDADMNLEHLRRIKKRLLIYSYEDREILDANGRDFLASVRDPEFFARKAEYLGPSRRTLEMLIIRDPFNCMASRLKMIATRGALGGATNPNRIIENWKAMAREALALVEAPDPGRAVVSYNHWATDEHYRRELCRRLGGRFDDQTMSRISEFGGGSSFDGRELSIGEIIANWPKLFEPWRYRRLNHYWRRLRNPGACKLKLFDRWREFVDDETFRGLVFEDEVLALSERLFGDVLRDDGSSLPTATRVPERNGVDPVWCTLPE